MLRWRGCRPRGGAPARTRVSQQLHGGMRADGTACVQTGTNAHLRSQLARAGGIDQDGTCLRPCPHRVTDLRNREDEVVDAAHEPLDHLYVGRGRIGRGPAAAICGEARGPDMDVGPLTSHVALSRTTMQPSRSAHHTRLPETSTAARTSAPKARCGWRPCLSPPSAARGLARFVRAAFCALPPADLPPAAALSDDRRGCDLGGRRDSAEPAAAPLPLATCPLTPCSGAPAAAARCAADSHAGSLCSPH
eukprot:scaffold159144_cov25-Tisochrysis_lutea.AAC.3